MALVQIRNECEGWVVDYMFNIHKVLGLIPSTMEQANQANKPCVKDFIKLIDYLGKHSSIKIRV